MDELNGFLGVMVKQSGFRDTVKMLGIVRDAETSAERAFQSVRSSLHNAQLPVPDRPGERAGAAPAVNVLILPEEQSSDRKLRQFGQITIDTSPAKLRRRDHPSSRQWCASPDSTIRR